MVADALVENRAASDRARHAQVLGRVGQHVSLVAHGSVLDIGIRRAGKGAGFHNRLPNRKNRLCSFNIRPIISIEFFIETVF
ncbi:ORF118 [Saltwater crocodilepox virus]|nr:ORF118 [Saltwater crocodilepox virus]